MAKKHKTTVITSLDQVPAGFVQIASLIDDRDPRRKYKQRLLSDAHTEGHIRASKLFRTADDYKTGPVFVDRDEALAYIAAHDREIAMRNEPPAPPAAPEAAAELRALLRVAADLRNSIVELTAAIELSIGSRGDGDAVCAE